MLMVAIMLVGAICLGRMPVDLLPEVSFPTVSVNTTWPNVSPEEIELLVTRPIEAAVSSAPGLRRLESTSYQGQSQVRAEFDWGADLDTAAVDVLQLVQRNQDQLPDDPERSVPSVRKFDPNSWPVLRYALTGPGSQVKMRSLVEDVILPRIEAVAGVASVNIEGGARREIRVDVDVDRLRAYNLTLADITRRIGQENINQPGGIGKTGRTEFNVRSVGQFERPEEVADIVLTSVAGQPVYLRDVAKVSDSQEEQRMFTRLNGVASIGLGITRQSGANTVETVAGVTREVEKLKADFPSIEWGVSRDQARFIEQSIHHTQREALIGGVLAILIILLFLGNLRSTIVIALSIPISVLAAFAVMYFNGFTLNIMSLGGIALGVGLIVDDAIVVLENIYRHIERDRISPRVAAVRATGEIATAVVAATITVMVVFLPLVFVRGMAGQMYKQFALAVVYSIGMSLVMALTVVPMMASRILKPNAEGEFSMEGTNWLSRSSKRVLDAIDSRYEVALHWALRHRWTVVGLGAATLAGALLLLPMVGRELIPATDSGDFNVNLKLPVGTSLEETNQATRKIETIVQKLPGVDSVFSSVGTSGFGNRQLPNQGQLTVRLHDGTPGPDGVARQAGPTAPVMAKAREQIRGIPGGEVRISQFDIVTRLLAGGSDGVELLIYGRDLETLGRLGREAMERVRDVPGLTNADLSWQASTPELRVHIDRKKAASLGLSFTEIANTVNAATGGSVATYYQEGGYEYPIRVQLKPDQRQTPEDIRRIVLRSGTTQLSSQIALPRGQAVLLGQVATLEMEQGPSQISRRDRERFIAVNGTATDRPVGDITAEIEKRLADWQLPEGYRWGWGGAQERMAREFGDLLLALILAVLLIYMVLAAQFESLVHPFTILISVPLSASGVILALFLTGRAFGMTAFIGLLMLVGIVVKNAILLVDYTNVLRHDGMERDAAILRAGPTRLRPILMTTGATLLGMFPLALGIGKGSETQAPMATAVMGGLTTSTMLTLLVIPVVYSLLDDGMLRFRQRFFPHWVSAPHTDVVEDPDLKELQVEHSEEPTPKPQKAERVEEAEAD
jgi:hydrophobic/amphiphilic exporter-1 (mainly G- bacteria), HAE1 family